MNTSGVFLKFSRSILVWELRPAPGMTGTIEGIIAMAIFPIPSIQMLHLCQVALPPFEDPRLPIGGTDGSAWPRNPVWSVPSFSWPWPGIRSEYSLRYSNFHWKSRCSLSFTSHGVTIEWWHQKWQHQPGVVGCQWESNNWGPADCRLFTDRFPNQGCPFIAMFDYPETMSCVWPGMG